MTLADLLARTVKRGTCRLWTGATYSNGYGKIYREGKRKKNGKRKRVTLLAHREAFLKYHGILTTTVLIVHTRECSGNKRCINPDHLLPAAQSGKMREWRARK